MVLVLAAVLVGALALANLAGRAQRVAQVQTAADAAALAAAQGGRGAAAALAAANGAELVAVEEIDGVVLAEVALGVETALAAAAQAGGPMAPALAAALGRAGQILDEDLAGAVRLLGPLGEAGIEVPRRLAARLAAVSHHSGLCRAGGGRPLHFVLCRANHPG